MFNAPILFSRKLRYHMITSTYEVGNYVNCTIRRPRKGKGRGGDGGKGDGPGKCHAGGVCDIWIPELALLCAMNGSSRRRLSLTVW